METYLFISMENLCQGFDLHYLQIVDKPSTVSFWSYANGE